MRNRLPLGTVGTVWTVGQLLLTSQRATNLAISGCDRLLRFHRCCLELWNCIRNDFLSRLGSISYTFVIGADNMPH